MTAESNATFLNPAIAAKPRLPVLFFSALTLFYLAFTPATIEGMGYNGENLTAAAQIVTNIFNTARHQPLVPMTWTRHGGIELLFQLPFVIFSRIVFGSSVKWAGRMLALQPILATSGLMPILGWRPRNPCACWPQRIWQWDARHRPGGRNL